MLGLAIQHWGRHGSRRQAAVVRAVALASAATCALGGLLLLLA